MDFELEIIDDRERCNEIKQLHETVEELRLKIMALKGGKDSKIVQRLPLFNLNSNLFIQSLCVKICLKKIFISPSDSPTLNTL